jgi:hypothetical protein
MKLPKDTPKPTYYTKEAIERRRKEREEEKSRKRGQK